MTKQEFSLKFYNHVDDYYMAQKSGNNGLADMNFGFCLGLLSLARSLGLISESDSYDYTEALHMFD